MIVASRRTEIVPNETVMVVVCSTDFDAPLIERVGVRLPYDPERTSGMGLPKPTVAVCNWVAELAVQDVAETGGMVPIPLLRESCALAGIRYTPAR